MVTALLVALSLLVALYVSQTVVTVLELRLSPPVRRLFYCAMAFWLLVMANATTGVNVLTAEMVEVAAVFLISWVGVPAIWEIGVGYGGKPPAAIPEHDPELIANIVAELELEIGEVEAVERHFRQQEQTKEESAAVTRRAVRRAKAHAKKLDRFDLPRLKCGHLKRYGYQRHKHAELRCGKCHFNRYHTCPTFGGMVYQTCGCPICQGEV